MLREMELFHGDTVHISYLTRDGQKNTYKEFLLSANSLDDIADDSQIQIPAHLLQQSCISESDDLQIICLHGGLLICKDTSLSIDELRDVMKVIKMIKSMISSLPDDLNIAIEQLRELIGRMEEGDLIDDKG